MQATPLPDRPWVPLLNPDNTRPIGKIQIHRHRCGICSLDRFLESWVIWWQDLCLDCIYRFWWLYLTQRDSWNWIHSIWIIDTWIYGLWYLKLKFLFKIYTFEMYLQCNVCAWLLVKKCFFFFPFTLLNRGISLFPLRLSYWKLWSEV